MNPSPKDVLRLVTAIDWDQLYECAARAAADLAAWTSPNLFHGLSFVGSREWAMVVDNLSGRAIFGTNVPAAAGDVLTLGPAAMPYQDLVPVVFRVLKPIQLSPDDPLTAFVAAKSPRAFYYEVHTD